MRLLLHCSWEIPALSSTSQAVGEALIAGFCLSSIFLSESPKRVSCSDAWHILSTKHDAVVGSRDAKPYSKGIYRLTHSSKPYCRCTQLEQRVQVQVVAREQQLKQHFVVQPSDEAAVPFLDVISHGFTVLDGLPETKKGFQERRYVRKGVTVRMGGG